MRHRERDTVASLGREAGCGVRKDNGASAACTDSVDGIVLFDGDNTVLEIAIKSVETNVASAS
jgi:hypothetical protein